MMRRVLAGALHRASLFSGHALRSAKAQRAARILTYHGIGYGEISAELFDWQLGILRDEFDLLPLHEVVRRQLAGTVTGSEVAITFDDGVRNHVTEAYPILRQHRAPATFFVCPGLVESGRWIWSLDFRARLGLLKEEERHSLRLETGATDHEVETLVERAKRLDFVDRCRAEAWLRERTREFSPSPQQVERCAPMSWTDIASLDPAIVTIGSHTLSHPILSSLSIEEQHTEIVGSRRLLEQRLGRVIDLFCYPNGDFDTQSHVIVRDNYTAAVTSEAAALSAEDGPFLLPRIHAGDSRGLFVRRLHRHAA